MKTPLNRTAKGNPRSLLRGLGGNNQKINSPLAWDPALAGQNFGPGGLNGKDGLALNATSTIIRNGGNGSMGQAITGTDYWLSANIGELIDCPHQPGNLKITKNACLKRHKASEKTDSEKLSQANLFLYTVGQGLLRCKTCSIIEKLP
jgi:hypothetical protein